jgi:hypothetical protein
MNGSLMLIFDLKTDSCDLDGHTSPPTTVTYASNSNSTRLSPEQ